MRFVKPVRENKLVEVVRTDQASDQCLEAAAAPGQARAQPQLHHLQITLHGAKLVAQRQLRPRVLENGNWTLTSDGTAPVLLGASPVSESGVTFAKKFFQQNLSKCEACKY